MYNLNLLSDNRKLSEYEYLRAKEICADCLKCVENRNEYIKTNNVDIKFALPDANWSYDAPNDFVAIFKRLVKANIGDLNHLRGLSSVFSGYGLYTGKEGSASSEININELSDDVIKGLLHEKEISFINENLNLIRGIPDSLIFRPPNIFGEIGHLVSGRIVNYDVNTYQERINILWQAGIIDRITDIIEKNGFVRIMEIGGGYGALAWIMKSIFPNCSYSIIDLPESILFSRIYLAITRPDVHQATETSYIEYGYSFIPNYMHDKITSSYDLIINTLSMSEMSEYQVKTYARFIRERWLGEGGIFFEQNQDNRHLGLGFAGETLLGEFEFHREVKMNNGRWKNGPASLWSNSEIKLKPRIQPDFGAILLEDCGIFNLIKAAGEYWLFAKHLGPIDPFTLPKRDFAPVIYFAYSAEEVKRKAGLNTPSDAVMAGQGN